MIVTAIPYWESDLDKRQVLERCIASLNGYDRLVILDGRQPTLTIAWNKLLKMGFDMGASHVILSNDDLILREGLLSDLCNDDVVLPLVNGSIYKVFHAHMVSIPRAVYEKVGEFDEIFKNYWADTDYAKRLVDAGIKVYINENVKVDHPNPGRTLKYTRTGDEDEKAFIEKWGKTYFDPVMGK